MIRNLLLVAASLCLFAFGNDEVQTKDVAPPPIMVSPLPETLPTETPVDANNRSRSASRARRASEYSDAGGRSGDVVARVPAKRARTWMMSFGPGLAFYNGPDAKETHSGSAGFSTHFGAVTQLTSDSPLFVGVDFGLQFWSFDSKQGDRSATGLQLLPTAYYNVDWNVESAFQPYVGISAGPHVYFSRNPVKGQSTSVNFEALLRPGVTFLMAPGLSMNFEPKLGIIGSDFVFLPTIAANLFL